jgi:uncharacterized damage-inducible protein DinB
MSELERLAGALDEAFDGEPWYGPSVVAALTGTSAELALDVPVPGAHRIADVVRHLAWWKDVVCRRLHGDPVTEANEADWPPLDHGTTTWTELLGELRRAHEELVTTVLALDAAGLDRAVTGQAISMRTMLRGAIDHDIYHAGQLVLLRRAGGDA